MKTVGWGRHPQPMTEYFGGWPRGSFGYESARLRVLVRRLFRKVLPWPLGRWLLALTIEERDRRRDARRFE